MPSAQRPTGREPATDNWRQGVQRAMLTVAAIVAPPIVIATIWLRSGSWTRFDTAMIGSVGVLVPLCRIAPGPLALRARLLLVTGFAVTFYYLGRNGLAGGISVALLTFTILASLSASRRLGVAFIALTLVGYVAVGLLAQGHHVTINAAASDPLVLRNWIRIGSINALLALLLISVVEFVVRSVEANARAANEALKWLRTAYDKVETTKEDERRFLSHELHDELGQTLTALKLSLQLAARGEPPPSGPQGATSRSRLSRAVPRPRRQSDRPRAPDLARSASAPPRRGRPRLGVAGLPAEPGHGLGRRDRARRGGAAVSIARGPRDRLLPGRSGVDHQRPPPRRRQPDRRPRRSVGQPGVAVDPG